MSTRRSCSFSALSAATIVHVVVLREGATSNVILQRQTRHVAARYQRDLGARFTALAVATRRRPPPIPSVH